MVNRVAIVKTSWADHYEGDLVVGRFGWLHSTKGKRLGHECFNFKPASDGTYYGYLPPVGRGAPQPGVKTGWLVIFIAAFEGYGRLTVVGWYENAVFADGYTERPEYQSSKLFATDTLGNRFVYCVSAKDACLIPRDRREAIIPGHHLRRTPIAYVSGQRRTEPWREELAALAEKVVAQFPQAARYKDVTANGSAFPSGSAEHRKRVEKAAVKNAKSWLR